MNIGKTQRKKKMEWHSNGTFSFIKGSRPTWISAAKKMVVTASQDRRHGLHGDAIITRACETFINNEIKKTTPEKTAQRLFRNLNTRIRGLKKGATLENLINTFRQYAFGHVGNLLPGSGDYNKAIEVTRRRLIRAKEKLHAKFFSRGELPDHINVNIYKKVALSLLVSRTQSTGSIKKIADDMLTSVIRPMIQESRSLLDVDNAIICIIGTTTLDIAFEKTKIGKNFNKRVLRIDLKIKQATINEEGLSRWVFNNLIGRPIPKKKLKR